MNSTEKYFKEDDLALHAWQSKYQHKNEDLDQFFERIINEFFRLDNFKSISDLEYHKFNSLSEYGKERSNLDRREIFKTLLYNFNGIIPGGSVLSGIGTGNLVSLSNCFVIQTNDSIEEIFDAGKDMSQIYKRRGGVGEDLSLLRPAGAKVNNAARTTSGVVPFMDFYSQVTNTIGQEGRRGALMLSIDINHPDSPEFITAKQDLTRVTGANVSVRLNGQFMKAVENDEDYILRWPCNLDLTKFTKDYLSCNYNELYQIEDHDNNFEVCYIKKIKAKELWESIIHCAWNTAEPGILFWDNIIENDPAGVYEQFKAVSTNPCGEIPLAPYDACRLIATNLFSIVDNPFSPLASINRSRAYKTFYEAQILADILVDLEIESVERIIKATHGSERELWQKIKEIGRAGRRTGTGITALADMLAALNKNYVSTDVIEDIMRTKMEAELDASIDLAIINGPFPSYARNLEYVNVSLDSDEIEFVGRNNFFEFIRQNFPDKWKEMMHHGRRNVSWSTIAPTGTISIMAGTSSGCEPVFSIYYTRRKKCNSGETPDFVDQNGVGFKNYNVVHGKFKEWFNINFMNTPYPLSDVETMSKEELDEIIKLSPWHNNIAEDINPAQRVLVQAMLQKYTTHSISSTVNVAKDTPESDIAIIYNDAYSQGCKGITVYRDGSRSGILVKSDAPTTSEVRPVELECKVLRFKNEDKKNWISFVGIHNNKAYEIFTGINDLDELPIPSYIENGKIIRVVLPEGSRYDFAYVDKYGYVNTVGGLNRVFNKEYWNYARFVSALLRENTPIERVINIIEGLTFTNKGMNSFQAGLVRSLKLFVPDGTEVIGETCENCGSHNIIYEAGCKICRDCGSSKCG